MYNSTLPTLISELSSAVTLTVTSTPSNFLAATLSIATVVVVVTTYNTTVSPSTLAVMIFNPSGTAKSYVNSPFSNIPSISSKVVAIVACLSTVIGLDNVPVAVPSV